MNNWIATWMTCEVRSNVVLAIGLGHMVCELGQWPARCVLCLFGDLSDLLSDVHEPHHTYRTDRASPTTPNTNHWKFRKFWNGTVWLVWCGVFLPSLVSLCCQQQLQLSLLWVIPQPMYHARLTIANTQSERLQFFFALYSEWFMKSNSVTKTWSSATGGTSKGIVAWDGALPISAARQQC